MFRQAVYLIIPALFLGFLAVSGHVTVDDKGAPIVHLKVGDLKGTTEVSRDGREFYAFRGIPYGHVPDRFEVSVEVPSWDGVVLSAEKFGSQCIHFDFVDENLLQGTEDCLFLNVFVPKIKSSKKKLPVLFWIHGGGFRSGNSDVYGPKYFMDEDVILVSINYRLGPFGYLNTIEGSYGNMGPKDQVLALKWVQKHIEVFSGDKTKVTIFGESAGAASTHHLTLSPMAKGLFRNAILMSGTGTAPWAIKDPANATVSIAKLVGCSNTNSGPMIKCLKKVDAKKLLEAQKDFHKSLGNKAKEISYAPSIEKAKPQSETFLSALPIDLLNEGKFSPVPIMNGLCKDEGVFIFAAYLLDNPAKLAELNKDFGSYAPATFDYDCYFPKDQLKEVSTKIKDFYFPDEEKIGPDSAQSVFDLFSDTFFVVSAKQAARAHAEKGPAKVFNYILNYKPQYALFDMASGYKQYSSYITHGDDLSLFFNLDILVPKGSKYSEEFVKVSKGAVKAWATFAAKGYPSSWGKEYGVWRPADGQSDQPLWWFSIDLEPRMIPEPFAARMDFWDELLAKHGHQRVKGQEDKAKIEL